MSRIRYFNNKREMPQVVAPGFVSFAVPEVFDEYVVSIDPAEDLLTRMDRRRSLDLVGVLQHKRMLVGPPPRRFHAPSLMLVLSFVALLCIAAIGALAIIQWVTP